MKTTLFCLVALLGLSSEALAQGQKAAPAFFASGGMFFGIDRYERSTSSTGTSDPDLGGTTVGINLAAGGRMNDHLGVRFELALAPEHSKLFPRVDPPPNESGSGLTAFKDRLQTGSVLVGYRTADRRRVRVEYLLGVAFIREVETRTQTTVSAEVGGLRGVENSTRVQFNWLTGVLVGVDVDISLGGRLFVVPQVRVLGARVGTGDNGLGAIRIRPGVSVRWGF